MDLEVFKENRNMIEEVISLLNNMQEYTEEEYHAEFAALWAEASAAISSVFHACLRCEAVNNEYLKKNYDHPMEVLVLKMGQIQTIMDGIATSSGYEDAMYKLKQFASYLQAPLGIYKTFDEQNRLFPQNMMNTLGYCYLTIDYPELQDYADRMLRTGHSPTFPGLADKVFSADFGYDKGNDMFYVLENGMKMYLPKEQFFTKEKVEETACYLHLEQDEDSPHRYLNERMDVPEGAVVMDAGVAEGNFSVAVIEKVKKLYLIEPEEIYIKALEATFQDYKDKVVIVKKFLCDKVDETHTTIDEIMKGEPLDYLKMDIEGAEMSALEGAKETFENSPDLKCNICVYHHFHDNEQITDFLEKKGFEVENTPGWMFFYGDKEYTGFPRRGLAQAVRRKEK